MTRSNASRDIGFMASSERLNVLLSRARNALIMIGNAETFINARKGKDIWVKFFDLMRREGYIFDGFPVKCERHPDRMSLLSRAVDFEEECPDGGCKEPWYVDKLSPQVMLIKAVQWLHPKVHTSLLPATLSPVVRPL